MHPPPRFALSSPPHPPPPPPLPPQDLLKTNGLDVSTYNVKGDTMLVSLQKGWLGPEVKAFLLSRKEVKSVTWNSQETFAEKVKEL